MERSRGFYIHCTEPNDCGLHNRNEWRIYRYRYTKRMYGHSNNECRSKSIAGSNSK